MDGGWGSAVSTPRRSRLRSTRAKHRQAALDDASAPQAEDLLVENEALKGVINALETKVVAYKRRYEKASQKAESEIIALNSSMERLQENLANIVHRQRHLLQSSAKQIIESTHELDRQETENLKSDCEDKSSQKDVHTGVSLEGLQKSINETSSLVNLEQESSSSFTETDQSINDKLLVKDENLKITVGSLEAKNCVYENKINEGSWEADSKINELNLVISSLQQQLISEEAKNQDLQQENAKLLADLEGKELQIKERGDLLIQEKEAVEAYEDNVRVSMDKLSADNERLKELEKSLETKLRKSELRYSETSLKVMEAESQMSELNDTVQRLQDDLDIAEAKIQILEKDNEALQVELKNIQFQMEETKYLSLVEQEIISLLEKDANMDKNIVANEGLKALVEYYEKGMRDVLKKYDEARKIVADYESKMNEQYNERQCMLDKLLILETENQILHQKIYICSYAFAVEEEFHINELNNAKERLQENLTVIEDEYKVMLQENDTLKEVLQDMQSQITFLVYGERETARSLSVKAQVLKERYNVEDLVKLLEGKIIESERKYKEASQTIIELELMLRKLDYERKRHEDKLAYLEANIDILQQKMYICTFEFSTQDEVQIDELHAALERLQKELTASEAKDQELQRDIEVLNYSLQASQSQFSELQEEFKSLSETSAKAVEKYMSENKDLKVENKDLKVLVKSHELKITECEERGFNTNLRITSLQSRLQRLQEQLATLQAENQTLQQQLYLAQTHPGKTLDISPRPSDSDSDSQHSEDQKENVDVLIDCASEKVGFSQRRPVAAIVIYKCLLQWKTFELEKTITFDRIHHMIRSGFEAQESSTDLAYWLSNSAVLLCILQKTLKSAYPSGNAQKTIFGRVTQGFRNSFSKSSADLENLNPIEAKQPAMLFKLQVEKDVEAIYGKIRDNMKMTLCSVLALVIQVSKGSDSKDLVYEDARHESQWQAVIDQLDELLKALQENYVPIILIKKMISQIFSYINVQLFNSFLLRHECCSFSNGEHVKHGLDKLEFWCSRVKQYVGSALDELIQTRQVVGLLLIFQKNNISLEVLVSELCPALSMPQIYRICVQYWDRKYNTQTVSPEVLQQMREMMKKHHSNDEDTLALVADERIPFNTEELVDSLRDMDISRVVPPKALLENPAFQFLQ